MAKKSAPPKIWLSPPHIGLAEFEYVNQAFESNWIAPEGPNVDGFENDLKSYLGISNVVALNSGTAALHLALIVAGIGEGDLVLCSSFTFVASANPIVYQGAIPVFIDSETETWNMDPDLAEEAIKHFSAKGQMPKAIVLVHLYGMPAKIDRFQEIARKYNIAIIEDAAEALGSEWNGQKSGTFGNIGTLSFNGNKIISTSGGGALITSNKDFAQKAKFLASQARDIAPHYQHSSIGYNYRLSNVLAGIGRGQIRVIADRIVNRRSNFSYYQKALSDLSGIGFLSEPAGFFSNRWLSCIAIDAKKADGIRPEDIRLALEKENIEARPFWKPMHSQPIYRDNPCWINGVSEHLFETGLCLPSGSNLNASDLQRIVFIIRSLWVR